MPESLIEAVSRLSYSTARGKTYGCFAVLLWSPLNQWRVYWRCYDVSVWARLCVRSVASCTFRKTCDRHPPHRTAWHILQPLWWAVAPPCCSLLNEATMILFLASKSGCRNGAPVLSCLWSLDTCFKDAGFSLAGRCDGAVKEMDNHH